jgi:hypothetical protein
LPCAINYADVGSWHYWFRTDVPHCVHGIGRCQERGWRLHLGDFATDQHAKPPL